MIPDKFRRQLDDLREGADSIFIDLGAECFSGIYHGLRRIVLEDQPHWYVRLVQYKKTRKIERLVDVRDIVYAAVNGK